MKKLFTLLLLISLSAASTRSQNLCTYGDFELYNSIPTDYCQWYNCTGWDNLNGFMGCGTDGSPDYFSALSTGSVQLPNTFAGTYIFPHGGNSIMGFLTWSGVIYRDYREYISTQLSQPMVPGVLYNVSFYLSNGQTPYYGYGTNNIGLYFSDTPLTQATNEVVFVNPQIEITNIFYDTSWVGFNFTFTPTTANQYLTIGNFRPDSLTLSQLFYPNQGRAYYYIDDIVITPTTTSLPVADFTASSTVICAGTCINYNNLSQNSTTYEWTFQGGSPANDTAVNPASVCYEVPGTYEVTLIASDSSSSDTATFTSYITVNALPSAPTITQTGDTLAVSQIFSGYQWFYGSDTIAGTTNYFCIASQDGNYNLIVTDSNGCSVGVGILNVISGISTFSKGEGVTLSPNPSNGSVIITLPDTEDATLQIFNPLGEIVYTTTISERQQTINTKLASGIYFVTVSNQKKTITGKLIVE